MREGIEDQMGPQMRWSPDEFEEIVAQAVNDLPQWVRDHMDNVAITVAPWPTAEQRRKLQHRGGQLLLGLYEGVPLTRRGRGYSLVPPDRITLFQGALESIARDDQALVRRIRRTVVHELAHHFGFSEARIRDLGY